MSASSGRQGPWLLGGVNTPAVPGSWVAKRPWSASIYLSDGSLFRGKQLPGIYLATKAVCGAGPTPIDWERSAESIGTACSRVIPGWDAQTLGARSEPLSTGVLGDLPLLDSTFAAARSLNLNASAPLHMLAEVPRSRLLGAPGGWLSVLDLSVTLECWWPHRELSPSWQARRHATTLEQVAEAIVREFIALDGYRLDEGWVSRILRRNSWGMPTATLDEIGREAGVTRERVRQIANRIGSWKGQRQWPLPSVLADAVEALGARDFREVPDVLADAGLVTDDDWTPDEVVQLIDWLGHRQAAELLRVRFKEAESQAILEHAEGIPIERAVRKARSKMGLLRIDAVANPDGVRIDQEIIREIAERIYSRTFSNHKWMLAGDDSLTMVESAAGRQFSVSAVLAAEELYAGLVRVQKGRSAPALPEQDVMIELLLESGAISTVAPDRFAGAVVSIESDSLTGWLAAILAAADGGVLHRDLVLRAAMRDEKNLSSVNTYLSYSPVVRMVGKGQGLYRLVGLEPTDEQIVHAAAVAEVSRVPSALEWRSSTRGIDLTIVAGSNFLGMGSIAAPAALCRMWPSGGASIACMCSRLFPGSITVWDETALTGWVGLINHILMDHHVREGWILSVSLEVEDARVTVEELNAG